MKTARFVEPGKIEFNEEDIPVIKSNELLVKIKASGVCGTDYHIYKGEVKGLVQPGTVLGHEFSGIVEGVGSGVSEFSEGEHVAIEPNLFCGACHYCRNAKKHFCENWKAIGLSRDGGFEEYVSIPASAAYKIPKGLSFEAAAFFEPMACVLHGIERGRISAGDTVIVQGAGAIGQLYIRALKLSGARNIIVSEIDESKLKLAQQFGATTVVNAKNESLKEVVDAETNGMGAQVFIDAAGLLSTIPNAMDVLENTGRIVIFGVPPEGKKVEIDPYEIYRREIEIMGSFTNPYTNEAALTYLKEVNVDPLLTNPISLDDLVKKGFNKFGQDGVLKIQIRF